MTRREYPQRDENVRVCVRRDGGRAHTNAHLPSVVRVHCWLLLVRFLHTVNKSLARLPTAWWGWAAVVCPRMATGQGPFKADARGQWRDVTSEMRAAAQGLSIQAKTMPQSAAQTTVLFVRSKETAWSARRSLSSCGAHLGLGLPHLCREMFKQARVMLRQCSHAMIGIGMLLARRVCLNVRLGASCSLHLAPPHSATPCTRHHVTGTRGGVVMWLTLLQSSVLVSSVIRQTLTFTTRLLRLSSWIPKW
jgi:hypothetical protein